MQEKEKKSIYHKMCTPFAFSTREYFCIYFILMSLNFFATLPSRLGSLKRCLWRSRQILLASSDIERLSLETDLSPKFDHFFALETVRDTRVF